MASAEEKTEIIQLVVGMVGAAPGAAVLAELEAIVDSGVTMEELAVAIAENPAFAGDDGLFPDFLPNAIFADQWTTALLGDSVSEENLAIAIDAVAGLLNSGTSRGAVMYAAITAIAAVDPADTDFGDAASLLANKTAVAEYYSITVAEDGEDLDALIAALDGVTEDEATVDTATDAIDTLIAANASLSDLIANKAAAEDALAALEAIADGDTDPDTSATSTQLTAFLAGVQDPLIDGFVAGYDAASETVKVALATDEQEAQGLVLTTPVTGLNALLADAQDDVDDIDGLESAVAVFNAAVEAKTVADDAAALAANALALAEADFDVTSGDTLAATGGPTYAVVTGAENVIVATVPAGSFVIADGIDDDDYPGLDALAAANLANLAAVAAATAADDAVEDALDQIENLDAQTAAQDAALAAIGADMDANVGNLVDPTDTDAPTLAEIESQSIALAAGVAQLDADVAALLFDTSEAVTEANHAALTLAAQNAGFIDAVSKGTMDAAFDAIVIADQADTDTAIAASQADLAGDNLSIDYEALLTTYFGLGDGTQTILVGTAPIAFALQDAQANVDTQQDAIDDLADALALRALTLATIDALEDLEDVVADADQAFLDAGFGVPTPLDSAVKAATVNDDIFSADGIDSQIISFGGDDVLYIGTDLTLNADTAAGDNGDNSVLEVWITGTTNAVITIEETVFGSEAATPETYSITLTGVAAADLALDADGFIGLA